MTTATAPEITIEQRREILRQIPIRVRLSIDGGRPATPTVRGVELTCGYGYRVRIELDPSDTYTVSRVYRKGAREWVKGSQSDVYCWDMHEVAYRAGMFRDSWPAGGIA